MVWAATDNPVHQIKISEISKSPLLPRSTAWPRHGFEETPIPLRHISTLRYFQIRPRRDGIHGSHEVRGPLEPPWAGVVWVGKPATQLSKR